MAFGYLLSAIEEEVTHFIDPKTNTTQAIQFSGYGFTEITTQNARAQVNYQGRPLRMLWPQIPQASGWDVSITRGSRNFSAEIFAKASRTTQITDQHHGAVEFTPASHLVINAPIGSVIDISTRQTDLPLIINLLT